jgi:hypothetical protein
MGKMKRGHTGKLEGKRPLRIPRRKWKDNFTTDLEERVRGFRLDLSGPRRVPVAVSCEQGNETSGSIKDVVFF